MITLLNNNQTNQLSKIIDYSLDNKYQELYEITNNESSLENTFIKIIDILDFDQKGQVRYLWMGLILADAVLPTLKAYLPNDQRPQKVFKLINQLLNNENIDNQEINCFIEQNFPLISEGCQALDEALDVFRNLLKITNSETAKEALLEILDCCIEGYAIFPGSQDRRKLFNWWLEEVVRASWNLEIPEHIYTINGKIDY
jgi:hypothetical protein